MLPIILDTKQLNIIMIGNGEATVRRFQVFKKCNSTDDLKIFADNPSDKLGEIAGDRIIKRLPIAKDLKEVTFVFIADFNEEKTKKLYELAKSKSCLVNTEDNKKYCDFHVPAIVKRGDLLLTVSTGGKSPRVARRLRQDLESQYSDEWAEKLNIIGIEREIWRSEGAGIGELVEKTDILLDKLKT